LVDGVHVTCVYIWCVIYHGYHTVYIRDGLIYIYHGKNTRKSVTPLTKKTMLTHKIAMPRPAVELAKVHHAILLRDAAPVRSCLADCRNVACSCGILSENRCHPTPSADSSDLEINWVVLFYKNTDIRCHYSKFVFTVVLDIVNKIRRCSASAFNPSLTPDRRGCNFR